MDLGINRGLSVFFNVASVVQVAMLKQKVSLMGNVWVGLYSRKCELRGERHPNNSVHHRKASFSERKR